MCEVENQSLDFKINGTSLYNSAARISKKNRWNLIVEKV